MLDNHRASRAGLIEPGTSSLIYHDAPVRVKFWRGKEGVATIASDSYAESSNGSDYRPLNSTKSDEQPASCGVR